MTIETVAILGAGTMGHALALVHALGGCDVKLTDSDSKILKAASSRIASAADTLVESNAVTREDVDTALKRIRNFETTAEAVADVELVVEAVVEIADVKKEVFAEVDLYAPVEAILASNSSYLDIFPLLPESRRVRGLIAHWYTPPYILDLVDLVPGPDTDPQVLETVQTLYERFGKTALVFTQMIPGYIANRLQAALNLECLRLIDEGMATAEQIDLSIREGLAARLAVLGHMRKADYTGLEMVRNGLAAKMYRPPNITGESATLDRMIAAGRKGVASGAGFFDYGGESPERLYRIRDLKLLKFKAALDVIERETE